MLRRCYSPALQAKYPTYIGCTVSENFKNFQWFTEWCQHQTGYDLKGYQLDKDILVARNKVYSEDVCVFVPNAVNSLIIKRDAARGSLPVGVCLQKDSGKYVANCSNGKGKRIHLGYFENKETAFLAYKDFKENLVKAVADEYRLSIDSRVYDALVSYEVKIDD